MSNQQDTDELLPTQTENYKVSEKKAVDELQNLDANDESLNKWKASLVRFPNDQRTVIVQALVLQSGDHVIRMDVSNERAIEELSKRTVSIKEGIEYTFKIEFVVQREVVSGLVFLQKLKRMNVTVERTEDMCGSFGPKYETQEKRFPVATAPSGMLARGLYNIRSRFVDDDGVVHLDWTWKMEIKKDW
ncbi:rho GDP dissociation inhibitor [Coemansia sp. IMI 209128]|uniref:Rho GDP dissociation inhibitor n=1 Tax=Coemansia linderi TaxID=2663919 RepID=A0ACC1KLS6_9FUNG|nr:rho GDP dissociation inhibitor [Coemansia sp. IMI 209128]KAJ2791381.1 rho GDP dissociation inhibitor [Coemansia linderi]